jgi:hypothetical protein
MPEPKQSSSNVGSNGVAWLLVAAAGTYFVVHTAPLEGNRPPTTEAFVRQQSSQQDIESRLWRDPFAAVAEKLAKSTDLKPENCKNEKRGGIEDHCVSPLVAASEPPTVAPIVMVTSVSGAPYSEDHESRRRQRYAIVAGLERQDFVPRDSEHLGFFWPRAVRTSLTRMPEVVPFEWFDKKDDPAQPVGKKNTPLLLLWFDEDALNGPNPAPLKGLDEFFCQVLRTGAPPNFDWRNALVLGPESSTTLKAMASELDGEWRSDGCSDEQRAQFYVSSATAADSQIIPGGKEQDCPDTSDRLSQYFKNSVNFKKRVNNVTLYRVTATDAALACLMRDELLLREPHRASELFLPSNLTGFFDRVKGKMPESLKQALGVADDSEQNHIVLISEWDTFYGQSLPGAMANCLGPAKTTESKCNKLDDKFIHRYSYLRGLDGQTPKLGDSDTGGTAKASDKNQDATDNQDKDSKDRSKTGPSARPNDRAEGQGQFDYLRRMGEEIASIDARLRSGVDEKPENRNRNGIFAVGVLGSDRYDKLLILQALRPLLPNARFFTTDLDALALHPTALPYTRNLLIASSFGLQLNETIQKEIPPFRNNYQTAAFFATQVAIRAAVGDGTNASAEGGTEGGNRHTCIWKEPPPPLLFEVGLSTLFQIPTATNGAQSKPAAGQGDEPDPLCEPRDRGRIHPMASDMFPQAGRGSPLAAAAAIVLLGIGITFSCGFMRRKIWLALDGQLARPNGGATLLALGGGVVLVLGLVLVLLAWAIFSWWPPVARSLTNAGQPMLWMEGISIWPTIVLRASILALCLVLLFHGRQYLNDDFWKLARHMDMEATWDRLLKRQDAIAAATHSPWTRFVSYFSYRMPADDRSADVDRSPSACLLRFWSPYVYQSRSKARMFRVGIYLIILFVLWGILELVFGNPPIPTRGVWAFGLYTPVSWLLNVAALFLTLFVADATIQCWRVIKALREETDNSPAAGKPIVWPEATLAKFSARVGLPPADLEHWVDLVFISKRTKTITALIYLPFVIVALVIVSRSRFFANYAPSVPEILVMTVALLIVTGSAVALRLSAEASRAKAHRRLSDQIMLARQSQDGEHRAVQLELLSRRVDELNEGALTPFSQQPLLRAMLLPLGSFGGTALLEYLLLPGFS